MRGREAVSGDADPVEAYREAVRTVLREFSGKPVSDTVRASALRALGRAGSDEDARRFLALLDAKGTKTTVREGAAIGLGLLPAISDPAIRDEVRAFATRVMEGKAGMTGRTQQVALMSLGLRARHDPYLTAGLAAMARRPISDANESAALLFALGLTREPMLVRELTVAARDGKLAGRPLHDVARSHAVMALAMAGNPVAAVDVCSRILNGPDAQPHTRRSAAITLGAVLRRSEPTDETRDVGERVLLRLLADDRDPLVSGYAAVGLGSSAKPSVIRALLRAAGRSNGTVEGPYAVLGLGLAARHLPEEQAKKIRRFLAAEYESCRDLERSGALAIAVGIGRATEARDLLLRRLRTTSAPLQVRALAAQALGVLGERSAEVEKELRKALDDGAPLITENAAIALGMLGHRETAGMLVGKLEKTRSKALQAHMMVALAHLGGTPAIAPLTKILKNGHGEDRVLTCAATVLGILADSREDDALFEIDASVNAYGMTVASRNLVQPY
jgi:HEAT repeat protein